MSRTRAYRTGPIGCVWDTHALCMLQVRRSGRRGLTIRGSMHQLRSKDEAGRPIEAAAAVREGLEACLRGRRFCGRGIATMLPREEVRHRSLRLPPMPMHEMSAAAHWQIAKDARSSLDEIKCACYDVGASSADGKARHEVLTVSALVADITARMQPLDSAGATVVAIEDAPGALARCLRTGSHSEPSSALIVDIGIHRSTIIGAYGGSPVFVRDVPAGCDRILEQLGEIGSEIRGQSTDLVSVNAGRVATDSSVGKAHTPLSRGARLTIDELAERMSCEIALCRHYLAQTHEGRFRPSGGFALGLGWFTEAFTLALNRSCEIPLQPALQALAPQVQAKLRSLRPDVSPECWLAPLGLALYGIDELIRSVAA